MPRTSMVITRRKQAALLVASVILASCGGGGSAPEYSITGTISGLSGSGLAVENGASPLPASANGPFTIASAVPSGTPYNISITAQPSTPTQTCSVKNGAGTVSSSDISNIVISCSTTTYMIGGTVSGLSGSGLTLLDNGTDALSVTANGAFTFHTPVASGNSFSVTVKTPPANPIQTCAVTNESGTVGAANITNVSISCATNTYPLSGNVSGLTGSGLLLGNGGDTITVNANGSFSFPSGIASGSGYAVSILGQPAGSTQQHCTFRNGSAIGTVTDEAVNSVSIACLNVGRFAYISNSISGSIAGYSINPMSGSLTPLAAGSLATGPNPMSLAITPNGKFAYVVNGGDDTVSAYSIDSTSGALSLVAGSPFGVAGGTSMQAVVTVHPSGQFLYVCTEAVGNNAAAYSITTYSINQTTGALTTASGGLMAVDGPALAFTPAGQFAYSISASNGNIGLYSINLTMGALGTPSVVAMGGVAVSNYAAIAPNGNYLYTAGYYSVFAGYTVDSTSGNLAPATNSPYTYTGAAEGIQSLALDPGGNFAYISNCNCRVGDNFPGFFSGFRLNGSTGAATFGAEFPADIYPGKLMFDPSGKFAYAGNALSNDLSQYSVDASSGVLTPIPGSPLILGTAAPSEAVISVAVVE